MSRKLRYSDINNKRSRFAIFNDKIYTFEIYVLTYKIFHPDFFPINEITDLQKKRENKIKKSYFCVSFLEANADNLL